MRLPRAEPSGRSDGESVRIIGNQPILAGALLTKYLHRRKSDIGGAELASEGGQRE